MMLDTKESVRDLALSVPNATRVFEKMGIDYCCGGAASLEQACASANASVEDVLCALSEANQQEAQRSEYDELQSSPLSQLINYILEKHHVFTKQELTRLAALLDKVCSAHGQNHAELLSIQALFKSLSDELSLHMQKEERVLFPYIIRMEEAVNNKQPVPAPPFMTVRNPVRMMSLEHDNAGNSLREMRRESADYSVPTDGCMSYRTLYQALQDFEQDLHQHIFLENSLLFPRAIAMEASLGS